MTRFFVSLFHFLVIALALIIIFSSFLFFSSNPQILFFIEPSGLNSDTRIIWGSIFGIFFGYFLMDEVITWKVIASLVVILIGIYIFKKNNKG